LYSGGEKEQIAVENNGSLDIVDRIHETLFIILFSVFFILTPQFSQQFSPLSNKNQMMHFLSSRERKSPPSLVEVIGSHAIIFYYSAFDLNGERWHTRFIFRLDNSIWLHHRERFFFQLLLLE